jgi:hypothetical protein
MKRYLEKIINLKKLNTFIIKNIQNEKGLSLIELTIIVVLIGITILPLSRLSMSNLKSGGDYVDMAQAIFYSEEIMEQIISDYAAVEAGKGYTWVIDNWGSGSPSTEEAPEGLTGYVYISPEDTLNGVPYVKVQTTISGSSISSFSMTTWLVKND